MLTFLPLEGPLPAPRPRIVFTTLVCIFGWKLLALSPLRPPRPPRLGAPPSLFLRLLLSALRLMISSKLRLSDSSAMSRGDQVKQSRYAEHFTSSWLCTRLSCTRQGREDVRHAGELRNSRQEASGNML